MTHLFKISAVLIISLLTIVSCKGDDDDDVKVDPKAENRKVLGSSGEDILSGDVFKKLRLELVYTPATKPTQETISALQQFLNARINKPGGISIIETEISAPNTASFSLTDIRAIEDENRTQYTEDDDIALYIFFASGSSENDTNTSVTLGSAYQNTSIVVYSNTLFSFSGGSSGTAFSTLETITVEHELGHLFSLVNLANDDIHLTGHIDPENDKHCVIKDCLMYFASSASRPVIAAKLQARAQLGGIPVFDDLCLADLQAKGGK